MMDTNLNQPFYDPSIVNMPQNFMPQNQIFPPLPQQMNPRKKQKQPGSSSSGIPSLHLPAILLFAFSYIIHAIATFIPYWSIYPSIHDARAGLWSARNFDYMTIQNFYFPEPTDFGNLTHSIRFTNANTKGYIVTVQFLMTFNFVVMLIVLVLLIVDYIFSKRSVNEPRSALIRRYNTSDTALAYGLLLYILYVFTVFEFAAWITYVGSRHDNNWHMHASFGLTIVVSVFLFIVFVFYVIEFIKIFKKNRLKWEYWYGPYAEWGFFVHLSALLLLLIVICCPEWAYKKNSTLYLFAEIGLFKQCLLSVIYKKSLSSGLCTLSNSSSNQSWVDATQAFMLMAYIFGMILLFLIVFYRKEFRHNQRGYHSARVTQPKFTFMIAGLILFFCFIFSLIGVSVFGAKVFAHPITVNWGYILAVFAMVLFLVAGILFILDGIHSGRQASAATSPAQKFLFPEPLNNRVLAMQPLIRPEPVLIPEPPIPPVIPPQPWQMPPSPFNSPYQQPPMYPELYMDNTSSFPPQQMMMMPTNYGMEQYPFAPITQAALTDYFRQMQNNPQLSSSLPFNRGLGNYSGGNPPGYPYTRNINFNDNNLNEMVRLHFLQQQRLNYNHERLLEKYGRLRATRATEFRPFGTSSLPGRNYDDYLQGMRGNNDNPYGNSLASQSRAGIGSADDTYRWMGNDYYDEPLPRDVSSMMQHSRNDPMPFVRAEKVESVKIYDHPIFGPTPTYIRQIFKKTKASKRKNNKEIESDHSDYEDERKILTTKNDNHHNEVVDRIPLRDISYTNWKTNNEHLIPVNPLLFDIYNQRSNGYIQGYGQLLYIPSSHYSNDRWPSYYENRITTSLSDTESVLADKSHEPSSSSSSKSRYHKLHSQPTTTTVSHQVSELLTSDSDGDLSGDEIKLPDPPTLLLSRNSSNSLTSSTSLPTQLASPMATIIPTTSVLSTQHSSVMNNAELIASHLLNIPLVSLTSKSASTSNSVIPHEALSHAYNELSTVVPRSILMQRSSNPRENNGSLRDNPVSSNSSDSDDDEKTKRR